MDQLESFADSRLLVGCIYCMGPTQTRDHVPSRILLDEPYPENLPVVPACASCNQRFSLDEEYVACLVECARTGSVEAVERPKIQRILQDSPALAARLAKARTIADGGGVSFTVEDERVKTIVLKLARGHAAYELNEQRLDEPSHVMFVPLYSLDEQAREHFETVPQPNVWPEVGTRAMQRMVVSTVGPSVFGPGWIDVQPGQYRYIALADGAVMVRVVLGEFLACEVIWGERAN